MAKIFSPDLRDNPLQNFIINGNMDFAQRGTSFAAIVDSAYSLDRFQYIKTGAMVHTISQDTDVPTLAESGIRSSSSLRMNLTTPDTSIAVGDYCAIRQKVEGFNFASLAQKPFTLSFWVKAALAGVYTVSFVNSAGDRSYVAEYTINAANTWEKKSVTVAASPSAGTWNYTNGIGLQIFWTLAGGSTFQTTPNAWQTGSFFSTANQVNGVNTGATDFRIAQVMLNSGNEASPFSLAGETIGGELTLCQRYYEKSYSQNTYPGSTSTAGAEEYAFGYSIGGVNAIGITVVYKVMKRAYATPVVYNTIAGASNSVDQLTVAATLNRSGVATPTYIGGTDKGFQMEVVVVASRSGVVFQWECSAEL
jgi:hypothetical protein